LGITYIFPEDLVSKSLSENITGVTAITSMPGDETIIGGYGKNYPTGCDDGEDKKICAIQIRGTEKRFLIDADES